MAEAAIGYDDEDKASLEYLKDERLFTHRFGEQGLEDPYTIDTSRADWLRNLPSRDLLSNRENEEIVGLGELGGATDDLVQPEEGPWLPSVPREAAIFKLRNLVGYNGPPGSWLRHAQDAWKKYHKVVGSYLTVSESSNWKRTEQLMIKMLGMWCSRNKVE